MYINTNNNVHRCLRMNTQRQSGRVAIKIDNIENKANSFNQSEDSKYTKFIYKSMQNKTLINLLAWLFANKRQAEFLYLLGFDWTIRIDMK